MALVKNKIQELESALSLDYAEGRDLNVISGNYALQRPLLGFTDESWRAITKVLALEYKQITNKFRDVLEILLGPDTTQATNIVQSYPSGVKSIIVNDTSKLPQTGTLILDKGTVIQEIIDYKFIDRATNTIFLSTKTIYSHQAPAHDGETVLLKGVSGSTLLYGVNTESLPQTGFPFPLVVGRGSATEETVAVLGNDVAKGLLTTSTLAHTHIKPTVGLVHSTLSQPYAKGSFLLSIVDAKVFPASGVIKLGLPNSDWQTTAFHITSGSTTVLNVASNTFSTADNIAGFYIAVFGPSSGSDRGTYRGEFLVKSNTTNSITLAEALPTTPASTWTFDVRPVIEFLETTDTSISLKYTLPSELPLPIGTVVEFLDNPEVITTGTIQVTGVKWKIVQATPHLVEILIPFSEDQLQNLRTASYIHAAVDITNPADVVATGNAIGDKILLVTNVSGFPQSGTIIINQSGANQEYVAFQKISNTKLEIPHGLSIAHLASETVKLWQPAYGSTKVVVGDINGIIPAVFPGPYLYDELALAKKSNVNTTLTQNLAAPTYLSLGLIAGAGPKAVEIEKGIFFPSSGTFQIRVGGTEQMTATAVSLAVSCASTLSGSHIAGVTTLNVTAGTLAPGGQANWPNATGYRALVGRGTSTAEIVYVTAISTGSNTITIQAPGLQSAQASGVKIELLTDVVTVSQIDSAHVGLVDYTNRVPAAVTDVPEAISVLNYSNAEMVEVLYSAITLAAGTGFASVNGTAIISFGDRIASDTLTSANAGVSSLVLQSSAAFPAAGIVEILAGQRHPVLYHMTANNTGTNTITITETTKTTLTGKKIKLAGGKEEAVEYASLSANTLNLTGFFTPMHNHQAGEKVALSIGVALPRTNGYDYPFRMPLDTFNKVAYTLDLVRAAGIAVKIIQEAPV